MFWWLHFVFLSPGREMGGVGEEVVLTAIRSRAFHFHMVFFHFLHQILGASSLQFAIGRRVTRSSGSLSVFERTAMEEMGWLGCIGVGFAGSGAEVGEGPERYPSPACRAWR